MCSNLKSSRMPLNVAALVAATGLLTVAMTGCDGKEVAAKSATPGAMPVSVVKAEQSDVPITGEWVGTLDGYVNAQIQPQATGYLLRQN